MTFLILLSAAVPAFALYLVSMLMVALMLRVSIMDVQFGFIKLIKTRIGNTKINVGIIPLSSSIQVADSRREEVDLALFPRDMAKRPIPVRVAVTLAGSLALLATSVVILGMDGLYAVGTGFRQIVFGALSFRTEAVSCIASTVWTPCGARAG